MKQFLFSILFVGLVFFLQAQQTVINDPNAEVRTARDFHGIEISNGISLYLTQSSEEGVAVSASSQKYRDMIHTEVKNGILRIWLDKSSWSWNGWNHKLKAYVSIKTMDRLIASGASDVMITGSITGDKLELRLSGASDLKGDLKYNSLMLEQSGASDATLSGTLTELNVEVSGASDLKGYDLHTDNGKFRATGASDIRITVNKTLSAQASGASSIHYKGEGVITDVQSSGASSVSKKN